MAMNIAPGRPSGEPDLLVDINTTPLIDVMLVLLIMLIITIPIQLHSVNLNLPVNQAPPPEIKPEVVDITIDGSGKVFWNGEEQTAQSLGAKFRAAATEAVPPELHVRPDRYAPYKHVTEVMASAQRNHATRIGIVGDDQFL